MIFPVWGGGPSVPRAVRELALFNLRYSHYQETLCALDQVPASRDVVLEEAHQTFLSGLQVLARLEDRAKAIYAAGGTA